MADEKFSLIDYLMLFAFLVAELGTFGLPLNLYQFVVLLVCMMLTAHWLYLENDLRIHRGIIGLFAYIVAVTAFNMCDLEAYKSIIFFGIQIVTFYLYIKRTSREKLYKLLYIVAIVFAITAIFQEIAFFLHFKCFYDFTAYGFPKPVIRGGILAVSSLCSEPSHCAPVAAFGMWIGLRGAECKETFVKPVFTALIAVFAVITMSAVVYMSSLVVVGVYLFVNRLSDLRKRTKLILYCAIAGVVILAVKPGLMVTVFSRLNQFKNMSIDTGNDLSAVALVSNFRIAVEKLKDGYFFGTGFDSHRIHYWQYINSIYDHLYQYLNIGDAGSLYIRIFSEFGIVGLFVFVFACVKKVIFGMKSRHYDVGAITILFMTLVLRNGQYENLFTVLCICIIWFSRGILTERKLEERGIGTNAPFP